MAETHPWGYFRTLQYLSCPLGGRTSWRSRCVQLTTINKYEFVEMIALFCDASTSRCYWPGRPLVTSCGSVSPPPPASWPWAWPSPGPAWPRPAASSVDSGSPCPPGTRSRPRWCPCPSRTSSASTVAERASKWNKRWGGREWAEWRTSVK